MKREEGLAPNFIGIFTRLHSFLIQRKGQELHILLSTRGKDIFNYSANLVDVCK